MSTPKVRTSATPRNVPAKKKAAVAKTAAVAKRAQSHHALDRITIRGAREHNLCDVSLDLPRDQLIVFTGLSGSGKSSLAFDTIYAEGQRRYVESLSSYARQFLGQMDKPDVDVIEGLSPAISIDQKSASRNPRSTVGTVTEVYDYLRLLFARVGEPHDPETGEALVRQTPQQIVDMDLEQLKQLIRPAGMYNNKSRNLKLMSQQLLQHHNGQVPNSRSALMQLAGVGRKSTDIMMRFVFFEPASAGDTHVHRIANRLGVASTRAEHQTAEILARDTPDQYRWGAHEWLIQHGKYVCKSRNPDCANCMLSDICSHYQEHVQ